MTRMNNLLIYLPLLVQLNEKEKKAIGIIAIILLGILLLLGLVARLLLSIKDRKGREIDNYMYDLVSYKIITTPFQFRSYVFKRETKKLYLSNRWALRVFMLMVIALTIYVTTYLNGDWNIIWKILDDFFLEIEWPTTKMFGLTIISDWPFIKTPPVIYLTLNGYVTYVAFIISLWCGLNLLGTCFSFSAKIDRSNKVSAKAFGKNLDNMGGNNRGFQ